MTDDINKKTPWEQRLALHDNRDIREMTRVIAGRGYVESFMNANNHFNDHALAYVQGLLINSVTSAIRNFLSAESQAVDLINSLEMAVVNKTEAVTHLVNNFFQEFRAAQYESYTTFSKKHGIKADMLNDKLTDVMKNHENSDQMPSLLFLHFQKIDAFDWLGKDNVQDGMLFKILQPLVAENSITTEEAQSIWQDCAKAIIAEDIHRQATFVVEDSVWTFLLAVLVVSVVAISVVLAPAVSFAFYALTVGAVFVGYRVYQFAVHRQEAQFQQSYQFPKVISQDAFAAKGVDNGAAPGNDSEPAGLTYGPLWRNGQMAVSEVAAAQNSDPTLSDSDVDDESSPLLGQSSGQ